MNFAGFVRCDRIDNLNDLADEGILVMAVEDFTDSVLDPRQGEVGRISWVNEWGWPYIDFPGQRRPWMVNNKEIIVALLDERGEYMT